MRKLPIFCQITQYSIYISNVSGRLMLKNALDEIDCRILAALQENARLSLAERKSAWWPRISAK